MPDRGFGEHYAQALGDYLRDPGDAALSAGHDLGRRALLERLTPVDVVSEHLRAVEQLPGESRSGDDAAGLPFLRRTLAALGPAEGGVPDGTDHDPSRPARTDDLHTRDAFHSALVNSLQEGFFVVDRDGTVVEVNEAFATITGCGVDGLPYRWPYPWLTDAKDAAERLAQLVRDGSVRSETPIRHRDGRVSWAEVSINSVTEGDDDRAAYVGTIRDLTAERYTELRRSAVVRLATGLGVATSLTEVLDVLLAVVTSATEVQRVVAVVWPHSGSGPVVRVAGSPSATAWGELDPRLCDVFGAARDWPPLTVEAVDTADGSGRTAGMMTVLSGTDDVVLWFEYPAPRTTSDEDTSLVGALIGHLSAALAHVRQFQSAREALLTLQRAMMPITKPPVGFAVRYEPAVAPFEIGGDWYDVLAIGDHQIGVIVGDCVGSGLPAAAVMGQLRSSARVLLVNGAPPGRLLDDLDSAAALIPGAYCATVLVCNIDTDTGEMTYASAGHIPALLAVSGATPETLTGATSVPLAVQRSRPRPETSISLPPGSTLLLYTDGLVERREALLDNGIERAGQVLGDMIGRPAETVADALLSRMTPPDGFDDDVAIVVYRRPPAPLRIDVAATPDRLSDVRRQLGGWLLATGITDELAGDIVLVVNEACSNSIEHGYRAETPGRMVVDVEAKGRGVCIRITDFGSWKLPDANPRVRGRGVPLMRAVSADVTLTGTDTGTTVVMNFEL